MSFKEKVVHELKKTALITLYFLVGFNLLALLFALLATPCMATFAITRRESGSWAYAALQWVGLTLTAYLLALIVYQAGSLVLS